MYSIKLRLGYESITLHYSMMATTSPSSSLFMKAASGMNEGCCENCGFDDEGGTMKHDCPGPMAEISVEAFEEDLEDLGSVASNDSLSEQPVAKANILDVSRQQHAAEKHTRALRAVCDLVEDSRSIAPRVGRSWPQFFAINRQLQL